MTGWSTGGLIAVPAVDLRDGAAVQLVGGDFAQERLRLADPAVVAAGWRREGFAELHLVDLDAAAGGGAQSGLVDAIVAASLPLGQAVQVGGGMGDESRLERVLAAGAVRVVAGTRAIEDAAWIARISARFPGRVVVAADVRGREVVTRGWTRGSGRSLAEVLDQLNELPLGAVLITAVHVEGRLEGPDLELLALAARRSRHPVQASGGIRSLTDLRRLADLGIRRGVIGMALYTGRLDPAAAAAEFGGAATNADGGESNA
ncbi:MAG: HisA/HisF-related TIM barrel protein [Gemmatimonadales bacterium]